MLHRLDSSWMDAELGHHREWVADEFLSHVAMLCKWADGDHRRSWGAGPDGIRLRDENGERTVPPSATAADGLAALAAAIS